MEERLPLAPRRVPLQAWLMVAVAMTVAYLVTMENGLVLRSGASLIHEVFHDGRHFFGMPCH